MGNATDLQGLEDDGLLDNILKRVLLSLSVCCHLVFFHVAGPACERIMQEKYPVLPNLDKELN